MNKPIHLIVRGAPVSYQSNRRLVREWKDVIAESAKKEAESCSSYLNFAVTITHFYLDPPKCDADNISKPICDALSQIVYRDDKQIIERTARQVPLVRAFILDGMPRELALALWEAKEFVYIHIARVVPQTIPVVKPRRLMFLSA